ncbi:MAG: four helix bundle protein [Acidobacteriota bacterium]
MTPEELKKRTKQFALRSIQLCNNLPTNRSGHIVANQLIRCSTSVGSNYRSACRARPSADFVSKMGITLEEADESVYWMEIIVESGMQSAKQVAPLLQEGNELVAIFVSSLNTAQKKMKQRSTTPKI